MISRKYCDSRIRSDDTGSKVRINVSLGAGARPTRIVPDVTGQDERLARRIPFYLPLLVSKLRA